MLIGVDGRGLRGGRGIARATAGILRALAEAHPEHELVVFAAGDDDVAPPHPAVRVRHDRRPQRAIFAAAALTGRPRLDRMLGDGLDVLWAPAPAPLAVSREVPLVLTVHDLSFVQRPQDFGVYERAWHRLARPAALAARARLVVCDSHATRAAVHAHWPGVDAARTRVVAPGFDRPAAPPAPWDRLPPRFFLAVGALEPRKGIDVLLRAFSRARAAGLDAELVLAGEGRLGVDPGPGVHVLGRVDEAQLGACYAQALALVMPSWLEGFGLPPLEAVAHGTPSIVSDLPVFDETLGPGGALRVAPGDDVALAGALARIAGEPELGARLVAAGRRESAKLTWAAAAEGMHDAFTEAAR